MYSQLLELESHLHIAIADGFEQQRRSVLLFAILAGGFIYGSVMGSYAGIGSGIVQILYSAAKVPFLLLTTLALSLPSFFVFNTLLGLRSDFNQVVKHIVGAQAVQAVLLASLSPYTMLLYASTLDYATAQIFSLLVFGIASIAGQSTLRRYYRLLIARDPRHRYMMWTWLGIYSFVGVQMAWVLRPFVGKPGTPTEFFRHDSWGNAYEALAEILWKTLAR